MLKTQAAGMLLRVEEYPWPDGALILPHHFFLWQVTDVSGHYHHFYFPLQ